MKQIQTFTQKDQIGIVLVGNKCDVENRDVTKEEGDTLSKEFGIKYFETSALNNLMIEETFNYLASDIIRIKDIKEGGDVPLNKTVNLDTIKDKEKDKIKKEKGCC
jgi:Ras-related protein Rab-8A